MIRPKRIPSRPSSARSNHSRTSGSSTPQCLNYDEGFFEFANGTLLMFYLFTIIN